LRWRNLMMQRSSTSIRLTLCSLSGFPLSFLPSFFPGEIPDFLIIHRSPGTSNGNSLDSPREGESHLDKKFLNTLYLWWSASDSWFWMEDQSSFNKWESLILNVISFPILLRKVDYLSELSHFPFLSLGFWLILTMVRVAQITCWSWINSLTIFDAR
jgi:hypothetical protein